MKDKEDKHLDYIFEANQLTKTYKQFKALDSLSFKVPRGSIYGLVGKNGAGKTTLIRLITGLQDPTSGSYALYGIDYRKKEIIKARRRIGAVVETPSLYCSMTAEENLKYQYQILGLPSYTGISELLQLVGLSNTGKKKVNEFSLGMKQRLGIALALAGDPDFLILDEPVNGLDPQGIIAIRELILKLNRERQMTILISSHILGELSKLATHYGFINNGRIIKDISGVELEAVCQKCTRLKVSDINVLIKIVDDMKLEYVILSNDEADIYSSININALIRALDKENCQLISIKEHDETLESFYMKLMGGGNHE